MSLFLSLKMSIELFFFPFLFFGFSCSVDLCVVSIVSGAVNSAFLCSLRVVGNDESILSSVLVTPIIIIIIIIIISYEFFTPFFNWWYFTKFCVTANLLNPPGSSPIDLIPPVVCLVSILSQIIISPVLFFLCPKRLCPGALAPTGIFVILRLQ